MDETAGLENRRALPGSVGSNPTPSAKILLKLLRAPDFDL